MKKIIPVFLASVILISCGSSKNSMKSGSQNSLTSKEKTEGWQLLFNGKNTDGWHNYGHQKAGNEWKVQDGAIHLDASEKNREGGDLVSNEAYGNFDLKLEWKISEKGNSGILFYVRDDPAKYKETYHTGIEMQVLDNGTPIRLGQPDGKIYTHRAGDLYDLLASKEVEKTLGEWNQIEIKCVNGKLDFYMNGEHTLSTTLWDDYWQKMIAISKFKYMPDFGTFKSGNIALQDHGDDVWFRNIKIRRL
ncbi:MAG: 3-keto-disaccharide hydrolase [Ginsengibacter sp.]